MSVSPEARLALLLLEELELRNGKAKLRYLKVYRMMMYWLGREYVKAILNKLVSTGYISIKDNEVELLRRFKTDKSQVRVYREARDIIINTYLLMQRSLSK
ncbi:hypothetical protein [Vulcanisaeta moutnovskia]|uniref:hypothetical protein n=1 Tax=Vulcanisaeta moutnovskia TaxID=985052 RepID=UPI00064E6DC9|nr:hypothetical protein [Vulcanisaeta moutnovskia]